MEQNRLTGRPPTDRISGLPVEIIHNHILTSLPDKYVKIMSSLSKTWLHITTSFPHLVFDDYRFGYRHSWTLQTDEEINKYLNYVNKTLQRFHHSGDEPNLKLQKLSITITFRPYVAPVLDSWIKLALRHGVEEFNLQISEERRDKTPRYDLPQALFDANNSNIKVAKFKGYVSFFKSFPKDATNHRPNSNLVKLCLYDVPLDEETLSSLIDTCPLIEELSILFCSGIYCVRISNLDKLKTLRISLGMGRVENYTINITAPSLQSLEIKGPVKVHITECEKLTNLDLKHVMEIDLQDILSRLPSLLSLSLSNLRWLTMFKVTSNTLKNLEVFACHGLLKLDIDAPNLLSGVYKVFTTPLPSLTRYVKGRWDVSTKFEGFRRVENVLAELSTFGSKVKHIEYLELYFTEETQPFSFKELNKRVVRVVANIDHLELCVRQGPKLDYLGRYELSDTYVPNISYPDLLDGVLWSCHPRTLSLTLGSICKKTDNREAIKHIRDIVSSHRRHCCSCTLARSWVHCLEGVTHMTADGRERQLPMDENLLPNLCGKIKFNFKW